MEIPNLGGYADPQNVSKKGTGSFQASYINWARTLHDIREKAPGWMPEMVEDVEGKQIHKAPDGSGYLMIQFRHADGSTTTAIPHAIMDHKMKALSGKAISARDVADSFVRGACKSAAALFGYAWQMWSKDDPMERTAQEDEKIAQERAEIKKGAIKQTLADVANVGNGLTDQHSTPDSLMEDDPIAIQESPPEGYNDALLVKWPGQQRKEFVNKTLGTIMKKEPEYLYNALKTKGDVIKDSNKELFQALQIVLWDYEDKNDMNFPKAK